MLTAAAFLATFERAGFLVDMTWAPAGGGAGGSFAARFEAGAVPVMRDLVSGAEPVIMFETAKAPALTNGDTLTVGVSEFKIREVRPLYDGTITRATLRKLS
jgi:hypothetical protein